MMPDYCQEYWLKLQREENGSAVSASLEDTMEHANTFHLPEWDWKGKTIGELKNALLNCSEIQDKLKFDNILSLQLNHKYFNDMDKVPELDTLMVLMKVTKSTKQLISSQLFEQSKRVPNMDVFILKNRFNGDIELTDLTRFNDREMHYLKSYLYLDKIDINSDSISMVWAFYKKLYEIDSSFTVPNYLFFLVRLLLKDLIKPSNVLQYITWVRAENMDVDLYYALKCVGENTASITPDINNQDEIKSYIWAIQNMKEKFLPLKDVSSTYKRDLVNIFDQKKYCYFKLRVTDVYDEMKIYDCHQSVLAASSKFFKTELKEHLRADHVTPLTQKSFKKLLDHWHGKEISHLSLEDSLFFFVWGHIYQSKDMEMIQKKSSDVLNSALQNPKSKKKLLALITSLPTYKIQEVIELEIFQELSDHFEKEITIERLTQQNLELSKEVTSLRKQLDILKLSLVKKVETHTPQVYKPGTSPIEREPVDIQEVVDDQSPDMQEASVLSEEQVPSPVDGKIIQDTTHEDITTVNAEFDPNKSLSTPNHNEILENLTQSYSESPFQWIPTSQAKKN